MPEFLRLSSPFDALNILLRALTEREPESEIITDFIISGTCER